jgi:hypothetical protein
MGSGLEVHMSNNTSLIRQTKQKAKYKKGSDDLLPIKATCAKLLYFSDYDRLRDVCAFFFVYLFFLAT